MRKNSEIIAQHSEPWRAGAMKNLIYFLLIIALMVAGSAAWAQQATKIYRIGYMSQSAGIESRAQAFQQGLREIGYVEGKNIVVEWRFGNAKADVLPKFAEELGALKVDVLLALITPVVQAVKKTTSLRRRLLLTDSPALVD